MKKNRFYLFLVALLISMPFLMSSCGDDEELITPDEPTDEPIPTPENQTLPLEKSEYTIIFYGHGGGDLDASILSNVNDLFLCNKKSYDKVHAVVQYKMSGTDGLTVAVEDEDFDDDLDVKKYGHVTLRFVVDPSKDFSEMFYNDLDDISLPKKDIDIASTSTLTDYIKWAVKNAPAEKYILLLSDHGGGYSPEDELPMENPTLSKGLIYDDGAYYDHFTAEKIVKAVQDAGIRPEVIYLDACLMNTIEYQYELKDITNYLVLSSFSVPGPGGDYVSLVNELAKNSDIEKALSKFGEATVKSWDEYLDEETNEKYFPYSDISVIRTSDIDVFGYKWKEFTEQLIDAYQNGGDEVKAAINKVTAGTMPMECAYALYDMNYFAQQVIDAVPEQFSSSFAKELSVAYDSYIVYRKASSELEKYGYKIGTSILFGCNNHFTSFSWDEDEDTGESVLDGYVFYEADGTMRFFNNDGIQYDQSTWNGTFDNTYKKLKFDRLTNWSKWIEINEQEASAYSPSGLYYTITENGFVPADGDELKK